MQQNSSNEEKSFSRYAYTLFSTLGKTLMGVITSIVIPKVLGPKAIGTIAFGQVIVQNVRGLFDFNVSQAFFNLSSSKRESGELTRLFVRITVVQILLSLVVSVILSYTQFGRELIQYTPFVLLILLLGFEWGNYGVTSATQLGNAKGISKWPQIISLVINAAMTAFLVALVAMKQLTIYSYLLTLFVFVVLSFLSIAVYLYKTSGNLLWKADRQEKLKNIAKSALKISMPLTILGYYISGILYIERLVIQYKYGAEEQAFFYLASKWASLVIMFSTASLHIFWQRLVVTITSGDLKEAGDIYLRLDGVLFYFTLCIALAWSFTGKHILILLLGKDFSAAGTILMIMAFYPVSQVFGQIGTTIALASGRAKEFAIISILTSTIGLVISYFLLMPRTAYVPGLGLGGLGLGIKTAVFGLIEVQLITFLNCKYLSVSYSDLIISKVKILIVLVIIIFCLTALGRIWALMMPTVVESIIRGILFLTAATVLLFAKPAFCGVSPSDLDRLKGSINMNKLRQRFFG